MKEAKSLVTVESYVSQSSITEKRTIDVRFKR